MKKLFSIFIKYTIFIFLLIPEYAFTQNSILIFNEDFESGNNPFIEDSSFGLPSGINKWIINNEHEDPSLDGECDHSDKLDPVLLCESCTSTLCVFERQTLCICVLVYLYLYICISDTLQHYF